MVGERREPPTAPVYNSGFRDALVEMGVSVASCGHDHANDYCLLSENKSKLESRDTPPAAAKKPAAKGATEDVAPPEEGEAVTPKPVTPKQPKNDKIWLCYGGGVGFGGYGGYNDYVRRLRFFEMDANEGRIRTWKRLEYGDTERRLDEQIIVDGGNVVSNGG